MDPATRIALRSGNRMPVIGLGTWKLTRDTAETVAGALECGYRMIDTAVDYGSQAGIGAALREGQVAREDLFVVTKIEETDAPLHGVVRDLSEMGLPYADLTLIHRPPEDGVGEQLWDGLIRARADPGAGRGARPRHRRQQLFGRAGRPPVGGDGRGPGGQPGRVDALRP